MFTNFINIKSYNLTFKFHNSTYTKYCESMVTKFNISRVSHFSSQVLNKVLKINGTKPLKMF